MDENERAKAFAAAWYARTMSGCDQKTLEYMLASEFKAARLSGEESARSKISEMLAKAVS